MDAFQTHELVDVIELSPYIEDNGVQILPFLSLESRICVEEQDDCTIQSPESDQQLIIDNAAVGDAENTTDEPKKRKGGWPKGKKRKQGTLNCKIPKAPTTGYILFLNERRKWYKATQPELEFASVTKMLGREWSNLKMSEKQVYLDKAEVDKQRYREELSIYQNENTLEPEKDRNGVSNNEKITMESSVDNDRNNNEESQELYCKVCDQYFISLHNKTEHLYGKQHLQMLTEKSCKLNEDVERVEQAASSTNSTSFNHFNSSPASNCHKATNINQAIIDFIELTFDRNEEISVLTNRLNYNKRKYDILRDETDKYQEREKELRLDLDSLNATKSSLKEQLETLRMVPSLFGVINFQH